MSFVANLGVSGVGNDLTSCNFPLEVLSSEKIQFSATVENQNTAILKWSIPQSPDGTVYSVEHSNDGITWDEIKILTTGTTGGSNSSFSQKNLAGGTHYYRIRKTEVDGTNSFSPVEKLAVTSLTTISIWPNPAQKELKVQDMTNASGTSLIFIYDYTGKMMSRTVMSPGVNSIGIESLPTGTYIARVQHASGEITSRKFLKQ